MFKIVSAFAMVMFLAGCQSWQEIKEDYNKQYLVEVGSHFTLLVPVVYPRGHARVFLQGQFDSPSVDGIRLASGFRFSGGAGINEYEPYCELEVEGVSDGSFQLFPDEFEVTAVEQTLYPWNIVSLPMQVAANDEGSLDQLTYATTFSLKSSLNPSIRSMSCRQVMDVDIGDYVTVEQMRQALQNVFKVGN